MTDRPFHRTQKPEAQGFDEVRIVCKPYFKTSGLSGDEWRTRYITEFYRNGKIVETNYSGHTSMDSAVHLLNASYYTALDSGKGYFAGEGDVCDQEGCAEPATVHLEQIKTGCGRCGTVKEPEYSRPWRAFCEEHSKRGDSRLDDMDANYAKLDKRPDL